MARKSTKGNEFEETLVEYKKKFNVDTLDSPNDIANLHLMIRNQILITKLQSELDHLTEADELDPVGVKKILDSIVALSEINISLERQLGIDRKTRKQESAESTADYISALKSRAKEWLDSAERLTKVFCKTCGIMVGRISGVYDTTFYHAEFQCPQCKKHIIVNRKERDVFFDVKDADWRRKYPIEIEQAKRTLAPETNILDDIMIGDTDQGEIEDGT